MRTTQLRCDKRLQRSGRFGPSYCFRKAMRCHVRHDGHHEHRCNGRCHRLDPSTSRPISECPLATGAERDARVRQPLTFNR